ncbi:hypothetical protein [Nostoc sp. FACHB-888]|uniref:hypothetical protein n=1 Tax=Nostoc sp. FACHB-888 TaxID=2692842 RepID=UPI00168227C4|nr:hypothetical protein [Nostoc sp. FACHB-888]MBD2242229.1 hypothetical protein [Nostoc sp. FACHB-888]
MKKIVKIITSIIITVYVVCSVFNYYWYSGFIPAKIEITYAIHIGGVSGIIREGCGAAIFRLSDATADAISRKGLDFFNDALYSRKSKERRYTYSSWKETPVPNSWTSEGTWPGLGCSGASRSLLSQILLPASKKGSYYSSKDEAWIVVIPSFKLVVFSYFG